MGTVISALVTKALRPIKNFNIENRAHRVISKDKPVPAPKYESNILDMQRALEVEPDLIDKINKKDSGLDDRLKNVYVTSMGEPEDLFTKKRYDPQKPLPLDRRKPIDYEYGFPEPAKLQYGHTTLRHVITFLTAHQVDPKTASIAKIAFEYKLKEKDVENIAKYFRTFEVYIPETRESAATFAGPSQVYQLSTKISEPEQLEESVKTEKNSKQ